MIMLLFTHVVYLIKLKMEEKKKNKKDKINRFNLIYAEDNDTDTAEDLDVRIIP